MSVVLAPLIPNWNINPQNASPIFNGTLPAEIRLEIFRLALTPYIIAWDFFYDYNQKTDDFDTNILVLGHPKKKNGVLDRTSSSTSHSTTCVAWAHEGRYCGREVLSLGLIGTCRRALAEARAFVHKTNERTIWRICMQHGDSVGSVCSDGEISWGRQRRKWERRFSRVKMVGHPNTNDNFFRFGYPMAYHHFTKIEHLCVAVPEHEIFFSNPDENSDEAPFRCLNPFGWVKDVEAAMEATKDFDLAEALAAAPHNNSNGRPAWMPPGITFWQEFDHHMAWGRAFINMPRLQTLTLKVEACEKNKAEIERMVQWALRAWQLPLNPNINGGWHYLSPEAVVQRTTTRYTCQAKIYMWEDAEEYINRMATNMCSWTLRWTRKKYNGPEVYPYGGLVMVMPDKDVTDGNVDDSDIDLYGDYVRRRG